MKRLGLYIFIMLLVGCELNGQKFIIPPEQAKSLTIPFKVDGNIKPLSTCVNDELQQQLNGLVSSDPKIKRLVSQKKMAIGLVLLDDTSNVKFARVNGNVGMYAASLPKIAILLATLDAVEKGELKETEDLDLDMRRMIARSDNEAATRLIDLLGFEKIESVLKNPKYLLYDEENGGGLWVGKRYAQTGRRYPEPLKGLSHAATVTQVCRFYYMLVYGELVSFERSQQMLSIMQDPELHHKFVNSLEKIAPKAKLFRKSGSWKNFHSDSILVWGPDRKYILVALSEDSDGEKLLRQLAIKIDNLVEGLK